VLLRKLASINHSAHALHVDVCIQSIQAQMAALALPDVAMAAA
jgi:hypothetical protein